MGGLVGFYKGFHTVEQASFRLLDFWAPYKRLSMFRSIVIQLIIPTTTTHELPSMLEGV